MSKLAMNAVLSLEFVPQSRGAPTEDPSGDFRQGGWVVPYADAETAQYLGDDLAEADVVRIGRRSRYTADGHVGAVSLNPNAKKCWKAS
jgi:hypothetical protein